MELCAVHNKTLGELCEDLGPGNNSVASFTLKASSNTLLMLTAEIYVDKGDVTEITEVLKKYELVERG